MFRPGEPDMTINHLPARRLAQLAPDTASNTLFGRGILVGLPLGETDYEGERHFTVAPQPADGDGRAVWFSAEQPPKIIREQLFTHATVVARGDGSHEVASWSRGDKTHLVYIMTGVPRPFGFERELAVAHHIESGGLVLPHGSMALESDVLAIESYAEGMPKPTLLGAFQDREILDDGQIVPFELHELWAIPEGCYVLVVSMSAFDKRKPLVRRLRIERGKLVVSPGKPGDYDRFRADSGNAQAGKAA